MTTIEQIAHFLLINQVSFTYEKNFIKVTDKDYTLFDTASYHAETKELVLMDSFFNHIKDTSNNYLRTGLNEERLNRYYKNGIG